jgi:SAM-dependent methyltransferase
LSQAERDKWDERYRDGAYERRTHPTALLAAWLPFMPRGVRGTPAIPGGRAVDVACGAGRNAVFLAASGFTVEALDISGVALERGLAVDWRLADLDDRPEQVLPSNYDLIVWIRYVNRALLPHLIARLRPGGHLICGQHVDTTADVAGPRSADFRLRPGELREGARAMTVRHYSEGLVVDPDGRTVALTQLVARATA